MKNEKRFLKNVPKSIWIVLFLLVVTVCLLPIVFIQPGWIDFTQTGQIGDTIGGTMGPFIAIIAAFLTFIAFWVQYEANIKQREDIAIERIEGKFYKMLDVYSDMSNSFSIRGIQGKEAFTELVGEFTYSFFFIKWIYDRLLTDPNSFNRLSDDVKSLIQEFEGNSESRNKYLTELSYQLFFYGRHYMVVDIAHPERTALAEEIKRIAFNKSTMPGPAAFSDYLKTGVFDISSPDPTKISKLFGGHSDFLGLYFRHLFQTVKFIASLDDSLIDEETKYGYVKLLRSQMSDYEQVLLYYNSLTEQGKAWNLSKGNRFPEDAGFISRFRMIKNIPPIFAVFGVIPQDFYEEDAKKWEKLGKSFYEQRFLPINRSTWNH